MRVTTNIFIFIFLALISSVASAQVTAVMQAKVNVVSGASLTAPNHSMVDLNSLSSAKFEAMNFTITAAPGSEIDISISQSSKLKNDHGEVVDLKNIQAKKQEIGEGNHSVSVEGSLEKGQQLNGKYQGTFTAVVEYL